MKFQIFQKLKASITINSLNYVHVSDINKPNNLQYRKSYPEIAFFDEDRARSSSRVEKILCIVVL